MKTLFKVLSLAVMLTALSAVSFAQDEPDLATLFEKFKKEAKAPCGEREAALATGKIIIEKFGSDELNKAVIDFVNKKMKEIQEKDPRCKLEKRYNAAFPAKNWPEFFAVSKQLIAMENDSALALDLLLTNVSVGYDRSVVDKNDAYAAETVSNAKLALQKIAGGKESQTKEFGVFDPFKTRDDAISWNNYILGYFAEKAGQKKESLGYYFKSTQVGFHKTNPVPFIKIGDFYFGEAAQGFEAYNTAVKANNNEVTDDHKKMLGLARANADRGIDAFGRAYKLASADPAKAAAKAGLLKTLTQLYKARFNLPETAKTPELESYVNTQVSKSMPDPASEIVPVVEEVKPAATTPTTTTTTTTPATKPTTTTPATKPTTKATTPAKATSTTTVTKPTSTASTKKPVAKKKGTR